MKKILSTLCAASLAITAILTPASATNETAISPLSPNAGETVEYLIIAPMPDGQPSKEFTVFVDVPEGATKAEQSALANQAAMEAAGLSSGASTRAMGTHTISTESRKQLLENGYPAFRIGGGMLQEKFSTLFIELSNISSLAGYTSKVNVRVENSRFPGANMYTTEDYSPLFPKCIVYMYAGEWYGNGRLPLDQGDWIDVYGSTDTGALQADVTISANK